MTFKNILISTILVALFAVSLIAFGAQLAVDNGVNNSILNDSRINEIYTSLDDTISGDKGGASNASEAFSSLDTGSSEISTESDLGVFSMIKVALSLPKFLFTIYTQLMEMIQSVLGIPTIVSYTASFIIIIVMITMAISLWRRGL